MPRYVKSKRYGRSKYVSSRYGPLGLGLGVGGAVTAPPGPFAPTIAVVEPVTNPPDFDVGLPSGNGAPYDTAVGDVIQIRFDSDDGTIISSSALDSDDITAGTIEIETSELEAGAHTAQARIYRSTGELYSPWSTADNFTAPTNNPYAVVNSYTGASVETEVDIGGTNYDIYTFPAGSNTITFSAGGYIDYLVVAGGGAGGGRSASAAGHGGGAAGGLLEGSELSVTAAEHDVTVGAGGTASDGSAGADGGDSDIELSASSIVSGPAVGGGGGGANAVAENGRDGGCGGGGAFNGGTGGTGSQGNNGGAGTSDGTYRHGGGGGGDSAAGEDAVAEGDHPGDGGAGTSSSITGSAVTYAGGGGGGHGESGGSPTPAAGGVGGGGAGATTDDASVAGTDGLGGGGGGGARATNEIGADGGDGVVIIRVQSQ